MFAALNRFATPFKLSCQRRLASSISNHWMPAFAGMTLLLFATSAFALPSVNVMADGDLGVAMARIARNYSTERQVAVNASFTAQAAQAVQISEGGAADILITPKLSWIEQLKTQGLVDIHSQATIAGNRLALVGPDDSAIRPAGNVFPTAALINALAGELAFVVGNPETLGVGVSGKEALRNLGVAGDLEPYTLYLKQADQMDDMVAKQHAYGIFYTSAATGKEGMRVIGLLPPESYHPVEYYAVVIAGENMNEARRFLEYLKSPAAKGVLRGDGFVVD